MLQPALFSSADPAWCTPPSVLYRVCLSFGRSVGLDPCSNPNSIVGAATEWSLAHGDDGLVPSWQSRGPVYCNPPYGRGVIDRWAAKIALEGALGAELVALLPARVDTHWFQAMWTAHAICFWTGRVKFLGAETGAPFPSCLPYWGEHVEAFRKAFSPVGKVLVLR